jgi:hypothetical protein
MVESGQKWSKMIKSSRLKMVAKWSKVVESG